MALAAITITVTSNQAQANTPLAATPTTAGPSALTDKASFYDSRQDPSVQKVLSARAATLAAKPKAGVTSLRQQLGTQGVVSIDPLTGTARNVAKLDGFLTAPSKASATSIALGYLGAHADVFGLDAAGIAKLQLRRDYVDIAGTHHLSYLQTIAGIPIFGDGIQANITKDGRLINVVGSPVSALPSFTAAPGLSATVARTAAVKDVVTTVPAVTAKVIGGARAQTTFSNGDTASLAYFMTAGGLRLTWQTLTSPTSQLLYTHIVDASTGRVLYRQSLTDNDSGKAWDYYPGAPKGGTQVSRNLTAPGWLPKNSPHLAGNIAHVYSDVNDDNVAQPSEEVLPSSKGSFNYPFVSFNATDGGACSAAFVCSWDPNTPFSWQTNRAQNAVQVYYYLGNYHDHLVAAPIGFTSSAGNFAGRRR